MQKDNVEDLGKVRQCRIFRDWAVAHPHICTHGWAVAPLPAEEHVSAPKVMCFIVATSP